MVSNFITILNGVITGHHSGDLNADFYGTQYYGHERAVVPEGIGVKIFDRVEFYGKDWKRKSDCQLIDEGLIQMPEGYVREKNELRKMTMDERIAFGIETSPPGFKLQNGKLVNMTLEEKKAVGLITQEEYDDQIKQANMLELQRRLAELQTPEMLAQAEIDEDFAIERKAILAELLEVKEQKGWPLIVRWPSRMV